MNANVRLVLLGALAVAAAVVLLLVLRGDDNGSGSGNRAANADGAQAGRGGNDEAGAKRAQIPTIVVRGGKPVGGVQQLSYEAGEPVRFRVRSDAAEELHVHGYDIERELPAGRTVRIKFPATIEGIFEAELHESGEQIAELRVNP